MNEEDRRELIDRQRRALYGNESAPYIEGGNFADESHTPRPTNTASGSAKPAGRGPSPRTYDPYAMGQNAAQNMIADAGGQLSANDSAPTGPSPKPLQGRSRADSTASPASNPTSQNFSLFENAAQQSSRTSTSSPGGSPPRQAKTSNPGVAPIGTRPSQNQTSNATLTKGSTTPSPSPLGYGFTNNENQNLSVISNGNERSTSAASNQAGGNSKDSSMGGSIGWGNGSGVWGSSNKSIQASVWG